MKDIGYFVISSTDIKNILALNRLLCLAPRTCVTMDQFSVGVRSLDNISLKSQGLTKPKGCGGRDPTTSFIHGFCRGHASDGIS